MEHQRVRASELIKKPKIQTFEDLIFSEEIKDSGFKTIKTNIAILNELYIFICLVLQKSEGWPDLNYSKDLIDDIVLKNWIEIDSYDPRSLKEIKTSTNIPITSCENLYGLKDYLPF